MCHACISALRCPCSFAFINCKAGRQACHTAKLYVLWLRHKDLSINRSYLAPADDGRCEMKKALVAVSELLETHEELAEAVVPRMCRFNDPTAVLRGPTGPALLPAHPWDVTVSPNRLLGWFTVIAPIRVEKGTMLVLGCSANPSVEDSPELGDVMPICPGHDQRQRDATPVHQQVSLGAFFSPDLWGSGLRLRVPLAT
jgi:hypothetical protein